MSKNTGVVVHASPGLDDYTLHLVNALSEFTRVAYSIDAGQLNRYGAALNPKVVPIVFNRPRRRNLWGFQEMQKLSKKIRKFNPDILHLQGDGVWESVLLRMLSELPLINTVHDPVKHIDQRNLLNLALQRDTIRRARGWVTHSEGLKDIFLKHFRADPARVLVHPIGIYDYYTHFIPRDAQREKTILFFGELRRNKGCDILLRAFKSLELPGWSMIVAGLGKGLDDERALMVYLGERLDFRPGFIQDAETADLFSRAGIVALPYRHGSQSGVLAIAAAFGCPVLATRTGSLPELVQHCKQVFFVEPENETDLRQGLLALALDKSLRAELGRGLNKQAQAAWNWKGIAERSMAFYEHILDR
jgi:glycosyltransferase involved in cell wall biosynthesis